MVRLILCFLLFLSWHASLGTHLRGGYVDIRHVSGLTYVININLWTDDGSSVEPQPGNLYINGQRLIDEVEVSVESSGFILAGPEISYSSFGVIHTFPAPGTYELTYYEYNRDAGILNVPNSVDIPFVVKTKMVIDPIYGNNSTPRPSPFAWGSAELMDDYYRALGINDREGDSLSFHRAVPLSSDSTLVQGYQFLDDFGDSFSIHPLSGELQWIDPNTSGKFTFAILVREWRKIDDSYVQLSESVFDGVINAVDRDNNANATINIENSNCLGFDQTHSMQFDLSNGELGRTYFTSDYKGTILIDGEALSPTGMGIEFLGDTEIEIEFVGDHRSSSSINYLSLVVRDTSNLVVGSRALHFSNDCSSLVTNTTDLTVRPIQFYPNPVNDVMNVDLSRLTGQPVEIQMYNSVGQEVYWDRLITDETILQFAVAGLPRGVYLIKVAYNKKQHTERIVLD